MLAKAKTGTGKTLGFCIPTCERLLRSQAAPTSMPDGIDPIRAIILSSTRELATQITTQAQQLLKHTNFNVEEILGACLRAVVLPFDALWFAFAWPSC